MELKKFSAQRPLGSFVAEQQSSRNRSVLSFRSASVDRSVLLQARDFVLHQQLATLKGHDLKIVNRWVGPRFVDLRFKGPMAFLKFRKMGFHGHVGWFSSASCAAWDTTPKSRVFEEGFHDAQQQSPLRD
jgi:hypothetical protein